MEAFADDESTLVPDDHSERTLLRDPIVVAPPLPPFLRLPLEIRKIIYRFSCISDVDSTSHPRLWAPSGPVKNWWNTGYFERGTVLPILLICRQVHDEAAQVLYGENVFAFHISVLSQGPVLFFQRLARKYMVLLRKVYIRTGFNVDTYDFDYDDRVGRRHGRYQPSALMDAQVAKDLVVSTALLKQAWPSLYSIQINKLTVLSCSKRGDRGMWAKADFNNWPLAAFHLWKMVVTEEDGENFRPEFRRVRWVEDVALYDTIDLD